MPREVGLPLVVLLVLGGFVPTGMAPVGAAAEETCGSGAREATNGPAIVGVSPNPIADGDPGEYVRLYIPGEIDPSRITLTDGEDTVSLPSTLEAREVILTGKPAALPEATAVTVANTSGFLALSNSGEAVRLLIDGQVVDCVAYTDAPEGKVLEVSGDAERWQALGATDFGITTAQAGQVRGFVLPDAAGVPVETLRAADRRLLLAGYTLTSRRVERALLAAARRNVSVEVLVDRDPVGGMRTREVAILDNLTAAGVTVYALGGESGRYEFHHAKYAVVDDRVLVTTENWKPAGTGGHDSRGWGAVTSQPAVVERLAAVFQADAAGAGVDNWSAARSAVETIPAQPATADYPARIAPASLPAAETRVLLAPDNAESAVVAALDEATESIRVIQMDVGGTAQPFVRATLRAARRGVEVQFLLSGAWYAEEENGRVVRRLRQIAAEEGLPLEARLAAPRGRFGKIHAKGVLIDGETVILGSLNWNNHSARQNREVALQLEGAAVASYYTRAFRADWRGPAQHLPGLFVVVLALVTLAVWWRGRRIEFGSPVPRRGDEPNDPVAGAVSPPRERSPPRSRESRRSRRRPSSRRARR